MSKNLTEAILTPPTFTGDEAEIMAAMNAFSSVVSSIGYLSAPVYSNAVGGGQTELSSDNKKAILNALVVYVAGKLDELCTTSAPPVVQPAVPTYTPPQSPVAPAQDDTVEITYESKQENPMLKRMRELAGIPHTNNRV